jgi:hypothetical protein
VNLLVYSVLQTSRSVNKKLIIMSERQKACNVTTGQAKKVVTVNWTRSIFCFVIFSPVIRGRGVNTSELITCTYEENDVLSSF